jgi:enoyl-CoA hydratase/carnithine racemase
VLPEALGVAGAIAASSPAAVRGARQALAQSFGASLEEQLAFEAARQAECFETSDLIEGITAIREKRDPKFRGS